MRSLLFASLLLAACSVPDAELPADLTTADLTVVDLHVPRVCSGDNPPTQCVCPPIGTYDFSAVYDRDASLSEPCGTPWMQLVLDDDGNLLFPFSCLGTVEGCDLKLDCGDYSWDLHRTAVDALAGTLTTVFIGPMGGGCQSVWNVEGTRQGH